MRHQLDKILMLISLISPLIGVTSCYKEVAEESSAISESNSTLTIIPQTRADSGDGEEPKVVYPVVLYIFDSSDRCVAVQTMTEDMEPTPIALAEGTFDVYAVGGASEERYNLPLQSAAQKTSPIALKADKTLDDLMTASGRVTLTDGQDQQLTLAMQRKVLMLRSVNITDVPTDVTAVKLEIQPLGEHVLLNGAVSGDNGTFSTALSKTATGSTTWKGSAEAYFMPSPANATSGPTISFTFTTASGSKTFSYTSPTPLPANYRLAIDGRYDATIGVSLTGVITGTTWSGDRTITLTFNEKDGNVTGTEDSTTTTNGSEDNNGADNNGGNTSGGGTGGSNTANVVQGTIPNVTALYKGCYVLSKNGNTVTILSSIEQNHIVTATTPGGTDIPAVRTTVGDWSVSELEGIQWRLPNEDEVKAILNNSQTINSKVSNKIQTTYGYIYENANHEIYRAFLDTDPPPTIKTGQSIMQLTSLRPVADITFEEE